MAAIIYRTFNILDTQLAKGDDTFADMGSIADYAKDAVLALKQAGIINGKGDNMFMPTQNATRAEASKVITMVRRLVVK
jgi:hypothetical protein